MAIARHRLPRIWLLLGLGLVGGTLAAGRWWQVQLPSRLEQAVSRGDLDACLRYSDQLSLLQWLPGQVSSDQGRCRRLKVESLWRGRRWREALELLRQLVQSQAGTPADRSQLLRLEQELQEQALTLFQAGKLDEALALLATAGIDRRPDGSGRGDLLREAWQRNRLQLERAGTLAQQQRWWEALEALNRLDHPWWKQQAQPLQQQVNRAVEELRGKHEEHHSHGELAHTVPTARLDALVRRHIEQDGMGEWQAFEKACAELGGKVVEAGPETACQR